MSAKHTPGPWAVSAVFRGGDRGDRTITAPIGPEIATVWARPASLHGIGGPAQVEGDAALIAAAPDLLALLREILRAGNANTRAARRSASGRLAIGFWEDVHAAIAKAEGRS